MYKLGFNALPGTLNRSDLEGEGEGYGNGRGRGGERDNECLQGGGLLGFGVGEVPAAVGLLVSW